MTTAFIGNQAQLKLGNAASPEVFTTVFEDVEIGEFGQENPLIKATHLLSTAEEYVYGLPDGMEFTVKANYAPTNASHVAMLAAQAAKTTCNMKYVLPPGGGSLTFSFAALIRKWVLGPANSENVFHVTFTLKISGAITGPV